MKFVCDKCHTKYAIDDARVRGKVLKIRCKACQNLITVRDPSLSGPESALHHEDVDHTHVAAAPASMVPRAERPSQAAVPRADWFVSFDGVQEGPCSLDKARARIHDEAKLGKEAHAWREGFAAWLPVDKIPELASALRPALPPNPPPRPPSVSAGAPGGAAGTAIPWRPTGPSHPIAVAAPAHSVSASAPVAEQHAEAVAPRSAAPAAAPVAAPAPPLETPALPAVPPIAAAAPSAQQAPATSRAFSAISRVAAKPLPAERPRVPESSPRLQPPHTEASAPHSLARRPLPSTATPAPIRESPSGPHREATAPFGHPVAKPAEQPPHVEASPASTAPAPKIQLLPRRPLPTPMPHSIGAASIALKKESGAAAGAVAPMAPAAKPHEVAPAPVEASMAVEPTLQHATPASRGEQRAEAAFVPLAASAPQPLDAPVDAVPLSAATSEAAPAREAAAVLHAAVASPAPAPQVPAAAGGNGVAPANGVAHADAPHAAAALPEPVVVVMPAPQRRGLLYALTACVVVIVLLAGALGYQVLRTRPDPVVAGASDPAKPATPPAPTPRNALDDRPVAIVDPAPKTAPRPAPPVLPPQGLAPVTSGHLRRGKHGPLPAPAAAVPVATQALSAEQKRLADMYREQPTDSRDRLPRVARDEGPRESVSNAQIMGVVTRNKKMVQLCFERSLKHDPSLKNLRVDVELKVGISGSVTGVTLAEPRLANSELGTCLKQTIRRWHFPAQDSEYQTAFPLLLQAQ